MADLFKSSKPASVVKNKPTTMGKASYVAKSVGSGITGAVLGAHPLGRAVKSVYKMATSAAKDYRKKTGGL